MKRITARHPNGEAYIKICPTLEGELNSGSPLAYIKICPTLEGELNSGSPLASVIIGEVLNVLADFEDEEERRGGYCTFCTDFTREGTEPRVKRNGLAYSCKYCPICGRKLREH